MVIGDQGFDHTVFNGPKLTEGQAALIELAVLQLTFGDFSDEGFDPRRSGLDE